jgi:transposase
MNTKRKHSKEFKARVSLELLKEKNTIEELAKQYEVHPSVLKTWKKLAQTELPHIFSNKLDSSKTDSVLIEKLYAQIGQLKVENDFLKKKLW